MASESEIAFDFPRHFTVYKDGRIEKPWTPTQFFVPPGLDPATGVESKDVVISSETAVKARLFLPQIAAAKLPLIIHYHGGAFCLYSPFVSPINTFLSQLSSAAAAIVLSVDYRLAPEHKLPAAYDDCLAALEWAARRPDPWLEAHADLGRVVLLGESAGANLAHYVAVQAGAKGLAGVGLTRMVLVHPYFGNEVPDPYYRYMSPGSCGTKGDPRFHPGSDPDLGKMEVKEAMVCVAEKDELRDRGVSYFETMRDGGGYGGVLEWYETRGEGHCFHLFKPGSGEAGVLMERIVGFVKQGRNFERMINRGFVGE
ncbi:unnamed protein product [Linum trigynum]|uniref:Alpha/beta hydrolase fold-3 domain-containing protein n=1 Tax=Linum trigynum TaxID=586398 RepID=A0AAV2GK72_9ROSI